MQTAEFVALKGLSGSGKSTELNIIGLLERPTSGVLENVLLPSIIANGTACLIVTHDPRLAAGCGLRPHH